MIASTKAFGLGLAAAVAAGAALGIVGMDAARAASQIKVSMAGSTYGPKAIKAKVGDTIVFTNDDHGNHWVYVPTVGFLVSKAGIKPGENFELKATSAGTFLVQCGLHTGMTATVTVEK
jgi:plastocyanin